MPIQLVELLEIAFNNSFAWSRDLIHLLSIVTGLFQVKRQNCPTIISLFLLLASIVYHSRFLHSYNLFASPTQSVASAVEDKDDTPVSFTRGPSLNTCALTTMHARFRTPLISEDFQGFKYDRIKSKHLNKESFVERYSYFIAICLVCG